MPGDYTHQILKTHAYVNNDTIMYCNNSCPEQLDFFAVKLSKDEQLNVSKPENYSHQLYLLV